MKGRHKALALTICTLAATSGCSWFRSEPPPLFPVDLCLKSSADAQLYRGKATTLYVRAYPLTLTDAFGSAEVSQLLADPPPQIPGAAGTPQSRILSPGGSDKLVFDASEGQAFGFVGVVAGYYEPQGLTKKVVKTDELRGGSCYTVEFGPAGITGGAPAPVVDEED